MPALVDNDGHELPDVTQSPPRLPPPAHTLQGPLVESNDELPPLAFSMQAVLDAMPEGEVGATPVSDDTFARIMQDALQREHTVRVVHMWSVLYVSHHVVGRSDAGN